MSAARSARRPLPALIFLLVLAVLAVVVWVRVSGRDSGAEAGGGASCGSAPQLPATASVAVTVLNANGTSGLASATLQQFVALGFTGGSFGNADPVEGVGTITAGPNGAASALLVSAYLPGATITADTRADTGVTVTLGAGFTGLASADQASAVLASAGASATPPDVATPTDGAATPTGTTAAAPTAGPTCFTTPPFPTPSAFVTASSS